MSDETKQKDSKNLVMDSNFLWIPDLTEMDFFDFSSIKEEEMNVSCDTTLSAIEGMELDVDESNVNRMLEQLERNISQVQAGDKELLLDDISLKEFLDFEQPQGPFACTVCDLKFSSGSNLRRHFGSIKHVTLAASQCLQTDPFSFEVKVEQPPLMTLDQMTGLDLMVQDYELMEHEMMYYELETKKRRNVRSRRAQKCRNREGKQLYRCVACPKVFTTVSNLSRHENLHDTSKLHECEICGKKFQQKEYLKKHHIVHKRSTIQR